MAWATGGPWAKAVEPAGSTAKPEIARMVRLEFDLSFL